MSVNEGDSGTRRDVTVQAMLDAAERLFSARGFTPVTVREIAREAGVSHALVHRYLGTKDEVFRAVLARNEHAIREVAGATTDLDGALSLMFYEGLLKRRHYLRLIAHSSLMGIPYETGIARFRATERLVELAEMKAAEGGSRPDAIEPRIVVAAIVALYVGWAAMEAWLVKAAGIEGLDEQILNEGLERIILGIADANLPSRD